jgi:CubicO group peptidase (beta-lactamase class C family)
MNKIKKDIFALFFIVLVALISNKLQAQEDQINKAKVIAEIFLKQQNIPGMSISVSKNGRKIWSEGFGCADIKSKQKIIPSKTQFRIASISKTITAVALAKLVGYKKLNLDTSLYTYVPDFPKKKYDFTIRQIGGHLAGIRHYAGK